MASGSFESEQDRLIQRSRVSRFTYRDLDRFDYDPPRRRLALCYWVPAESRWNVYRGSGQQGWTELHVYGELLFGPSPWARACVLAVYGRLGSVEAAVKRLPVPDAASAYYFEFEPDPDSKSGAVRARYVRGLWSAAEADFVERAKV